PTATPTSRPSPTPLPQPTPTPAPTEGVLYQEGFDSGTARGWQLEPGWSVSRDAEGNLALRGQGHQWARYTGASWDDFTFKMRVRLVRGRLHINYRVSGCNRYFLGLDADGLDLSKTSPCDRHASLGRVGERHSPGRWYEVKVVGNGSRLDIYVDGVLKLTYVDPEPLVRGNFAFESLDDSEVYVDDVVVTGLLPPASLRWQKTGGPSGGLGYDVRMRTDNPDRMYVTDAWSGVNLSQDGGRTWTASNEGIISRTGPSGDAIPIFSLTISPHNPDVIWAGTQGRRGIFKSTDGGRTWAKRDTGGVVGEGVTFRGFTVHPREPDTVYAAAEVSSFVWAGEPRQGKEFDRVKGVVYKTVDGGLTWQAVWRGDNLARYIWIDPRDPNVVYVSTGLFDREAANSNPATGDPGGVGIVKSTDGGRTWRTLGRQNGLNNLYIGSLFMHPTNPNILLAGASNNAYRDGSGVYLSTDGGETWQHTLVVGEASLTSVEFSLSQPDVAYAAGDDAFYRSQDGGRTWQLMSGGPPSARQGPPQWGPPGTRVGFPIDFQVDPRNPNRVFANAYGGGNFLSEDGGRTWVMASQGYTGAQLADIAVDPRDSNRIYTIGRSGFFRGTGGGSAWEGLNYEPATFGTWYAVALDPRDADTILISDEHQGVVLRTTDGGRNWSEVFRHPQVNASEFQRRHGFKAIAFAPSNSDVVYAGMARERRNIEEGRADPSFGIYKSTDGGRTWQEANDARTAGHNINALAVDWRNPAVVYAGTVKGGIFRTTDGGRSWVPLNQGLGVLDIRALAMDPGDPQVLYAGAENGGLYKSTNGGLSWQRSGTGVDALAAIWDIVIDPTNPRLLYAGDFRTGVYRSDDGGQRWMRINTGLSTRAINALAISADGRVLYAATQGEGVFRLETGGG
ncbi:MAG: family 16 glycoside hydrolase, partial [Chloroflexota bacterium]